MGRLRALAPYFLLSILLILYVTTFGYLAVVSRAPHMINRGGSLLSALGAVLVVWQVLVEEKNVEAEKTDIAATEPEVLSPSEQEIADRIAAGRAVSRRDVRIRIVALVAILILVGELMHGWGDFVAERTFMKTIGAAPTATGSEP